MLIFEDLFCNDNFCFVHVWSQSVLSEDIRPPKRGLRRSYGEYRRNRIRRGGASLKEAFLSRVYCSTGRISGLLVFSPKHWPD